MKGEWVVNERIFSDKELEEQLSSHYKEADELLQDEDKLEDFVQRLERKLKAVPYIGERIAWIPTLISLVRSYVKKEYTKIPFASIISILAALIYFVSPIDLLPDFIPGIGYIDDVAVLMLVMHMVKDDVDEYKEWKEQNKRKSVHKEQEV